MTPRRAALLVALTAAACGRTGLEVDTPVLVDAGPWSSSAGGADGQGAAAGQAGSGATGGTGGGGASGHAGTFAVGGSGGNPPTTCDPDQAPCVSADTCCAKVCHNEDIPVCGPAQCGPVGTACLQPTDCCSKTCADGICGALVCAHDGGACTTCAAKSCCAETGDCTAKPACAADFSCAEACIDAGKPFLSCWQTCVATSLVSNALFACISAKCPACQ